MKIPFFSDESLDRVFKPTGLCCRYPFVMVSVIAVGNNEQPLAYSLAAILFSIDPAEQGAQERRYSQNFIHLRFNGEGQLEDGKDCSERYFETLVDQYINQEIREHIDSLPVTTLAEGMRKFKRFFDKYLEIDKSLNIMMSRHSIFDDLIRHAFPEDYRTGRLQLCILEDAIENLIPSGEIPEGIGEDEMFIPTALGNCLNHVRLLQLAFKIREHICSNQGH